MDRQDLECDASIMETVVSLDWASPTAVEATHYEISNLTARICFRGDDTWIIDNELLSIHRPKSDNGGYSVEQHVLRPVYINTII